MTRQLIYYIILEADKRAGVLELADEADSKSVGSDTVRVRPPPPAPEKRQSADCLFSVLFALRRVVLLRSDIVLCTVLLSLREFISE